VRWPIRVCSGPAHHPTVTEYGIVYVETHLVETPAAAGAGTSIANVVPAPDVLRPLANSGLSDHFIDNMLI
jgi:hypothetical protein